jgi:hypothetical protein
MNEYESKREYFKLSLKADTIENVTEKMEEKKHKLMLENLKKLEEKVKFEKAQEEITEKISAYEYDCKKLKKITEKKVVDEYSTMLATERILDTLGIENYRIELVKKTSLDKEIEQMEESIEQLEEYYGDEEYYYDDEYYNDEENQDDDRVNYMNIYKYKDEFYIVDLATDIKKKNLQLTNEDIYFKKSFEIPIEDILEQYYGMVCQKSKNDGKTYYEVERMEIYEFLYKNLKQEKEYKKQIEMIEK